MQCYFCAWMRMCVCTWLQEDEGCAGQQHPLDLSQEAWLVLKGVQAVQTHHSIHAAIGLQANRTLTHSTCPCEVDGKRGHEATPRKHGWLFNQSLSLTHVRKESELG